MTFPAPASWSRRQLLRGAAGMGAGLTTAALAGACSTTRGAPEGATVVTIWSWLTGMDQYVAEFNASQQEVYVELSVIAAGLAGGYAQQSNAIRAHNAPDILHVEYQGLPQVVLTGGLLDLTDRMADLVEDYDEAGLQGVSPDGRIWAVPLDLAPMVLYYRQDLFEAEGLSAPTTWQDFRDRATAVREADPGARLTTFPLNDGSFFAGISWGAGDPWWQVDGDRWRVDVASEGTLRTADYWQAMIDDDLVSTIPTSSQDWSAAMNDGRLWGLLGASWSVGLLNRTIPDDVDRWAATPMPVWDADAPANGIQGGSAFAVSAESQHPDAAMSFLRWLSTDPASPRLGSTFTVPFPAYLPNREVAREAYVDDYFRGEPVYDVLDEAARRVAPWTWGPNALGLFSTVVDEIGTSVTDGSMAAAMTRVQDIAVGDMRGRGLAVVEGQA